jgi:hypothetical protein
MAIAVLSHENLRSGLFASSLLTQGRLRFVFLMVVEWRDDGIRLWCGSVSVL